MRKGERSITVKAAPPRKKNDRPRPGRPVGSSTFETRERILDVAESLFAEGGFDATSIRNVATGANVAIAVVTYHVGSKAELFDAVIKRRATFMSEMRVDALRGALEESAGAPVPIEVLARAYVMPFLQFARTHDRGWQNFAVLMGRLSNSPQGTETITRYYDDVARSYLDEMFRTLPGKPRQAIIVGFLGMVSLMLFVCAGTGRLEALTGGTTVKRSDDDVNQHILDFCVAGLMGLEVEPGKNQRLINEPS